MKILLLNSERGWRGGEAQTLLLAKGLRAKGHEVTIACPAGSPLSERAVQADVNVFSLPMKGSLALSSVWKLRAWIKQHAPALVHAQTAHAHSAAALALIGNTIPLVVARRVNFPLSGSQFTRWKYRRAQKIIAISQAIQQTLVQHGVPTQHLSVIPDGVEIPELVASDNSELCKELHLPTSTKLVLCIANLSTEKNHETLLQAWKTVEAAEVEAHLVLVGDGERRGELMALASSLHLQTCHFIGFRNDIPQLLQAAHVVVLSSKTEGLGSILLEAQARAVPVIGTAAGGIPEAIQHQRSGLVVAIGDAPAFAQALLSLLTDSEQHQRFSQAARQHCLQHYAASTIVEAHLSLYQQLLSPQVAATA